MALLLWVLTSCWGWSQVTEEAACEQTFVPCVPKVPVTDPCLTERTHLEPVSRVLSRNV